MLSEINDFGTYFVVDHSSRKRVKQCKKRSHVFWIFKKKTEKKTRFLELWRERIKSLQYFCNTLPLSFLSDQTKLLFWKKMHASGNAVL